MENIVSLDEELTAEEQATLADIDKRFMDASENAKAGKSPAPVKITDEEEQIRKKELRILEQKSIKAIEAAKEKGASEGVFKIGSAEEAEQYYKSIDFSIPDGTQTVFICQDGNAFSDIHESLAVDWAKKNNFKMYQVSALK